MKSFVAILALAIGIISAANPKIDNKPEEGWHVPHEDGTMKWVTVQEYELMQANMFYVEQDEKPAFYLYTNFNRDSPQKLLVDVPLKHSHFESSVPTRFIIHGWQNNYQSDVNRLIREAIFQSNRPYNIICVDWGKVAAYNYYSARNSVESIGRQVAMFIDTLNAEMQMSFSDLQVIGHSLGAHVSGFAGKNVKRGRISQITGLDPAYPLFYYDKWDTHLGPYDAEYVESIHTCGDWLGIYKPIGRASFYPNGGKKQPGCFPDPAGTCAHSRAYIYYAEAIVDNSFMCKKCHAFGDIGGNLCSEPFETQVRMGATTNPNIARNLYYVPVHDKAPFGLDAPLMLDVFPAWIDVQDKAGECSNALMQHIEWRAKSAMKYLTLSAHFSLAQLNMPNLADYFNKRAWIEFQDARKLITHLSKSSQFSKQLEALTKLPLQTATVVLKEKDAITALEDVLNIENHTISSARKFMSACTKINGTVTTAYLAEQLNFQREITEKIDTLRKLKNSKNDALGEFLFDKEL